MAELFAWQQQAEPWLLPISPDAPAGTDARYEAVHEQLRNQMDRLDMPTGGEVDWPDVVQRGASLLREVSKDVLISSYVAHGLYATSGLSGLATGLWLISEVVDRYWDDLFPTRKRMRARAGALEWLLDRVRRTLADVQVGAQDREAVEALTASVKHFESIVSRRFEEHAPALRPLLDDVARLQLSLPSEEKQAPDSATPDPSSPKGTAAASPPAKFTQTTISAGSSLPGDVAEVPEHLRGMAANMQQLARLIFREARDDSRAYRLSRVALYLHLDAPPPRAEENRTAVPPPSADLVAQLPALARSGSWPALLDEAESALATHRFWVDLQYWVARALNELGSEYEAARRAVCRGTSDLLGRFPTLRELQFADGRPFVGPLAAEWLDLEVTSRDPGSPTKPPETDGIGREFFEAARRLQVTGKNEEAIQLLQDGAQSARNARVRFEARLVLADVCSGGGSLLAALAILEELSAEMRSRGLQEWDPPLAARCHRAHFNTLVALSLRDPSVVERSKSVYAQLACVDPQAALAAGEPKRAKT